MRRPRGFTLLELLVVIGIAGVLLALLLSVVGNAWRASRALTCSANLRELGQAMAQYVNDNRGVLPPASITYEWTPPFNLRMTTWDDLLARYVEGEPTEARQAELDSGFTPNPSPLLRCPDDAREPPTTPLLPPLTGTAGLRSYSMTTAGFSVAGDRMTYGMGVDFPLDPDPRTRVIKLSQARHASTTLLLVENHSGAGDDGNVAGNIYLASTSAPWGQHFKVGGHPIQEPPLPPAHAGRWNYLFCDGHVERLDPAATVNPWPGLPAWELWHLRNGMWLRDPSDSDAPRHLRTRG